LRAQANTKDGLSQRDRFANQVEFPPDITQVVISRHGTTHEDESTGVTDVRNGFFAAVEIDVLTGKPARSECV